MKKIKKAVFLICFILPAIIGFAGYKMAGAGAGDAAYGAVRMYLFDAADNCDNAIIEIARWAAPIVAVTGLIGILKKMFKKVNEFFCSFRPDAVALYGDAEFKNIADDNIKHSINVDDDEVLDVKKHMIMFQNDEKGFEFYKRNKEKLCGDVFMKIEKNDSFSVCLDNVKFFNPCEIVARNFWQEYNIKQILYKNNMKIAIVGSNVLARKILEYALLNNIYSLTQKIEYHIWSDDDFFKKAHCDFEPMNDDIIIYEDNSCENKIFEIASADRIIITDKKESEFIAEIAAITKGEIYCFDPADTFVNVFEYDKIFAFGSYRHIINEENIRTDNLYSFAKKLNYAYTLKYLKDGEVAPTEQKAWEKLDKFTKGSNIASTDHCKIMLLIMSETGKKEVDYEMGELEHIRWCRFHFLNHWKYGKTPDGKKDARNKIHPSLVPYNLLSEEEKLKDINAIKTLLSIEK